MTADSAARPADHRSLDAEQVAAFLRANPAFLAARPELLAAQEPPARVYGDGLTDHLTAMVRAARDRADAMAARASAVLSAGRASSAIAERMQEAIIAVLHAADPAECVTEAWPGLLGVDAAALCCEAIRPRWRTLPQGAVKSLLRGRPVVVRDRPGDAVMLHAEAALLAERDVLVRLPGRQPALLALVSREPSALPATQSWSFLGRVLAALLYGA
jgi:uncharacterized protein YigA (DUF484 family)